MTSSHTAEFFNEKKNLEDDIIFKRSVGSDLEIPLPYEHVGLKHQYVYGDSKNFQKDIPIIGKVNEIYKKDGSYYANFNFENGKGPIIGKDENWYLSASDDIDKVIEFGLTKNPKRNVTHIRKMDNSISDSQKHFQMILENEKKRLLDNHPENIKEDVPVAKKSEETPKNVNSEEIISNDELMKSLEEKDKLISILQKNESDMKKEKESQQQVLKQMQTALMEIWNDQSMIDARRKLISKDQNMFIQSTPVGKKLTVGTYSNEKTKIVPTLDHVSTMTFMLGLMKQKRESVEQTNSDIENLPSSSNASTKKRRLIA